MTPARATEIIRDAKARAIHGPWSDQLSNVMPADERAEIIAVWNTMPGYTCFVDALHRIKGTTMRQITLAEYNAIHPDRRSIWTTERDDLPNWERDRHLYMGKRTMMSGDGTCRLLIEGLSFVIVDEHAAAGR